MRGSRLTSPRRVRSARKFARGKRAWGVSDRGGQREHYRNLIEDGQYPGLRVTRSEYDPRHPQEFPIDATDAFALERPSPDPSTSEVVVELPAPHPDYPSESNWLPMFSVNLGGMEVESLSADLDIFTGNEVVLQVGTMTAEGLSAGENAFPVGTEVAVILGNMVVNVGGAETILAVGEQVSVVLGAMIPTVEVAATATGTQVGVQLGTLVALSPDWGAARFGVQYQGINLLGDVQRQ